MVRNYFLVQNAIDAAFAKKNGIDHDALSIQFQKFLEREMDDSEFAELLIYTGYIPDRYASDSSEETLFSKFVEVIVCEWAKRMGFYSQFVKQKASYEDVNISINGNIIVCDAKSFRLGRSQQAPNVKDFLKLEDIRKWLIRHPNGLGGLVTYPCTHEWQSRSDAYQYCSTKNIPTVMLPYKYLSFLLMKKDSYNTNELTKLWDYERLFPHVLSTKLPGGNKSPYWVIINNEILQITKSTQTELQQYLSKADILIRECIMQNIELLKAQKANIVQSITAEINKSEDIKILREEIIKYKIANETDAINDTLKRIQDFRL